MRMTRAVADKLLDGRQRRFDARVIITTPSDTERWKQRARERVATRIKPVDGLD